MQPDSLLTAQGIARRFHSRWVLEDVGFTVRAGEVLGLIGPNGAGKTTLFECIAGLQPADEGSITFHGKPLSAAHRKEALFYLPDAIVPWAEQTVSWLFKLFEGLYGRNDEKAVTLVRALNLEGLMQARLGSLSKGERKRALLAMGLLTAQPLLLLDEPFDGLDLRQTREVMTLLRDHAGSDGRTLILSIHQLTDAARVCDRLVLLSAGRIAGVGNIAELRQQAKLPEGGLEEIFLALT